jgi:hypothetical protein
MRASMALAPERRASRFIGVRAKAECLVVHADELAGLGRLRKSIADFVAALGCV